MLDEQQVRLECRLAAIEMIVGKLFAVQTANLTGQMFDELVQDWTRNLDKVTIPSLDAAQSDAIAAQYRDEILRLFAAFRELRRSMGL